ncbi:MAG TPA: hypothetical protein VJB98_02940 [Candidatus Paceibacterota bacterium]
MLKPKDTVLLGEEQSSRDVFRRETNDLPHGMERHRVNGPISVVTTNERIFHEIAVLPQGLFNSLVNYCIIGAPREEPFLLRTENSNLTPLVVVKVSSGGRWFIVLS